MNSLLRHLTEIDFSNSADFSEKDLQERAVLIGVVAEIVLSKKLHTKNETLKEFIDSNFAIEYGEYLYKSRTLLLSRLIRLIESSNKETLQSYIDNINAFLTGKNEQENKQTPNQGKNSKGKSKRKSTMDSIDSWRKVISGEDE